MPGVANVTEPDAKCFKFVGQMLSVSSVRPWHHSANKEAVDSM